MRDHSIIAHFVCAAIVTAAIAPITVQAIPATKPKPATVVLALDSEGLRVVNASTGSTRTLPFGLKEADVVSSVTTLRGKPQSRSTNRECGAGALEFAQWSDGLNLLFQKGRFVGWDVNDLNKGARRLTTMAGIGVGSTRTALEAAYKTKISQSTLGTEFSAGKLGGLLSRNQKNARVTNLWSGTTCMFR
ncbi:MAG: hypothetical protein MUC48_22660 [Leptolyngbya sp. Prado105]|jgi:hypothetical protein|nr:hypothetical protein [Leptolyngbya sp. Prado105]